MQFQPPKNEGDSSGFDEELSFKDVAKALGSQSEPPPRARPAPAGDPAPGGTSSAEPRRAPPQASPAEPAKASPAGAPPPEDDGAAGRLAEASATPRHMLEGWLAHMCKVEASDLILRSGGRPSARVHGRIGFLPGRVPGPGALLEVLQGIMGPEKMERWRETGSVDAALHLDGLGRFRLNAYRQMGEPAVVIRRISEKAPELDSLELPAESLKKLALRKRGLVLVTGIAGSGKSTTLAAMIQYVNRTEERHVVTLEDPIELMFTEDRCVISQREVGADCTSFQDGLRHALRQSPDCILIGEMRDAETVTAALDATETGHLVLSTLHTINAPQTVERILSFYPSEQHAQVRARMAENLAGVLSQRLLRRSDREGLVPAVEMMLSTPHIRDLLYGGNTAELARVIEMGTERDLLSFNQSLRRLVKAGKVELEDALTASDRPEELVLALRGITGSNVRQNNSAGGGLGVGQPGGPTRPRGGGDGLRLAGGE